MFTTIIVIGIFIQVAFFFLCCLYYIYFSTTITLSPKTKKYQRTFFLGTIAQALVPLIFLLAPAALVFLSIFFNYYDQSLNNFIVLFISFHDFVSTFIIILIHHPYRQFLIQVATFDKVHRK